MSAEFSQDVEDWMFTLLAIDTPEKFREQLLVILGDYGAKYGGTPGVIWRTKPPHIDTRKRAFLVPPQSVSGAAPHQTREET